MSNNLTKIRQKLQYSQKKLAKASGVPYRTLQNWELYGVRHATVGNLEKVAKVLGCTIDDLL